jgi:hypothetical protein
MFARTRARRAGSGRARCSARFPAPSSACQCRGRSGSVAEATESRVTFLAVESDSDLAPVCRQRENSGSKPQTGIPCKELNHCITCPVALPFFVYQALHSCLSKLKNSLLFIAAFSCSSRQFQMMNQIYRQSSEVRRARSGDGVFAAQRLAPRASVVHFQASSSLGYQKAAV